MCVYDNVYFYKANDNIGVVRADSLAEATDRLNDYYNGVKNLVAIIKLSEIDNDYGVVEFTIKA